jgi:hypothetical protein
VLLATLALSSAAVAYAASLSFDGRSLGTDAETISRCTAAGLAVIPNLSGTTVVSVTVSSLPSACANATLQVTLNNQVTASGGSTTVPAGGGAVTVTLAAAVAVTAVEQIDLVLTGP